MSFMRIPPSNESTGAAAGYVRNQINQIGGGEQPLFTEKLSANLPMALFRAALGSLDGRRQQRKW